MPARSHEQTRDALQEWLYDNHPKDSYPWIKSVFDATFVYQHDGKLYQRTYEFDANGNLGVGAAQEVTESYEPIAAMSAFAIDGEAVFDGDVVRRTGKLFEVGDWPDKGFSLTPSEMQTAVAAFKPVPNDLEHRDTILNGKIGKLEAVEARGNELFGTVSIPKWLNDTIKDAPLKVSLAWDRATKQIVGNGLVLNPRIADAQVFAAFSQYAKPRRGTVMDIWSKLKALFAGSTSPEHQLSDEEKANLAKFAGATPTPTPGGPNQPDPETVRLRDELRKRDEASLSVSATQFADQQVTDKKAMPGEKDSIIVVYKSLAMADASKDGAALFTSDGKVAEGENLKALRQIFSARPKLEITEEQLKGGNLIVLSAEGEGGKPAIDSQALFADRQKAMAGGAN